MMSNMPLLERFRTTAIKPDECAACGRDLAELEPVEAMTAPGLYCSDVCAEDGESVWAW